MRYLGRYPHAKVPTYATLAQASTASRRQALVALAGEVATACADHAIALPDVHRLSPIALSGAKKSTLVDGYEGRSAKVKRLLEDMRKSLPPEHLDLCPYCSLETTAQIDHYLPSSRYPEFALYGPNLLPICPICNQSKGKTVANAAGQRMILMPTDDVAIAVCVLKASVVMLPTPHFTFSINPAAPVTAPELELVERHFTRLKLAPRYRRRAHSLMAALKKNINDAARMRSHEQRCRLARRTIADGFRAARREEPTNGWRLAFYKAVFRHRAAFVNWLAG